jgi:hypothetical protein
MRLSKPIGDKQSSNEILIQGSTDMIIAEQPSGEDMSSMTMADLKDEDKQRILELLVSDKDFLIAATDFIFKPNYD